MNRTSNVTAAFNLTLGGVMQSFHCQGLFLQSLLRYIRTYCIGRMRQNRLERMVAAVLQRDGIANPSGTQLQSLRRRIRESLKPGQKVIDVFAQSFLIGRTPPSPTPNSTGSRSALSAPGDLNCARHRAERWVISGSGRDGRPETSRTPGRQNAPPSLGPIPRLTCRSTYSSTHDIPLSAAT